MAIDRARLVRRHNPVLRSFDPESPLSVGNGEIAFTVDCTGLQAFADRYADGVPLCTQSQWGWHSFPPPPGESDESLRLAPYDSGGRTVGYATSAKGQEAFFNRLRQNPHRLNLCSIGLHAVDGSGRSMVIGDAEYPRQELDLWTGIIKSECRVFGVPFRVSTSCHPAVDAISILITSPLCASGLSILLRFPYGSPRIDASDWQADDRHQSDESEETGGCVIRRTLDGTRYWCVLHLGEGMEFRRTGLHSFHVLPRRGADELGCVFEFSPVPHSVARLSCAAVERESTRHWEQFWSLGGCLELAESEDPRAFELERRIVLSQYLTAIQCAGSLPPQETGLSCNSWYGKFHLEMHYWHAGHFPLWQRAELLERSLGWYRTIQDAAAERARSQGYRGARWPKMTAPDGADSPSPIGPLIIWEAPVP